MAVAIVLLGSWSAYQKYGDPPGNRLTKWSLAGVIEVDGRGTGEAIRDAYSEVGAQRRDLQQGRKLQRDAGDRTGPADLRSRLLWAALSLAIYTPALLPQPGSSYSLLAGLLAGLALAGFALLAFGMALPRHRRSAELAL